MGWVPHGMGESPGQTPSARRRHHGTRIQNAPFPGRCREAPGPRRLEPAPGTLPDGPLPGELPERRGVGRGGCPVEAMWRATVAGVVLRHEPIGSLIRGLRRNPALPDIRGSGPPPGAVRAGDGTARMVDAVPDPWNLTRFLPALAGVEEDPGPVSGMGSAMRTALMAELPGSGRHPGHGGEAIAGHSTGRKDGGAGRTPGPGAARGRHGTAGAGAKTGRPWRKVKGRSGYTPHVIAGTTCGIPVGISVQPAPVPEAGEPERMSGSLMAEAPDLAGRRGTSSAGRGPGSGPLKRTFRDGWETRPAIGTRLMWSVEKREPGPGHPPAGPGARRHDRPRRARRAVPRLSGDGRAEGHGFRGLRARPADARIPLPGGGVRVRMPGTRRLPQDGRRQGR